MEYAPMIGTTVSHYTILEKLGGGGMGVVYKARDTRLNRVVALKFLPPNLTQDEQSKKRFIQDAQAASSLQHPAICTIHDIDETKDGQLFIVMECYDGETLKQRLQRGPLAIEDVENLAAQMAQGLLKAHESGIIHRDLKSANVMITGTGSVKIIDFGLAKLLGAGSITKTGTTHGTISYMCPEQIRGGKIDHRCDLWSFGVLLYEMVTGVLPFASEFEQATMYRIISDSYAPVASLRPDAPQHLVDLIGGCTQASRPRSGINSSSPWFTRHGQLGRKNIEVGADTRHRRSPGIVFSPPDFCSSSFDIDHRGALFSESDQR
jgi:serine/threonine protein kinase